MRGKFLTETTASNVQISFAADTLRRVVWFILEFFVATLFFILGGWFWSTHDTFDRGLPGCVRSERRPSGGNVDATDST